MTRLKLLKLSSLAPSSHGPENPIPDISDDQIYFVPDGTMHPDGRAFVKTISTTDADVDIRRSWTSAPDDVYCLLPDEGQTRGRP